jgi:hypothetical protein
MRSSGARALPLAREAAFGRPSASPLGTVTAIEGIVARTTVVRRRELRETPGRCCRLTP